MLIVSSIVMMAASSSRAAPPSSAGARPVVELVVAAPGNEAAELAQVATELLGRLSVEVRLRRVVAIDVGDIARPVDAPTPYRARAFVDLKRPAHAVLWFVDSARDRVLIRDLERSPGREEITREELAHILEASTEGLLAGESIGVPRAEALPLLTPKAPEPPKAQGRPPPPGEHVQVVALYEVQMLSGAPRFQHGPELGVFLPLSVSGLDWGLSIGGQYRLPQTVDAAPAGARFEGGAIRALVSLDQRLRSNVRLQWGLGAGVDIVDLTPTGVATDNVSIAGGRVLTFAIVRAAIGLSVRVLPNLSIWSRVAADFDFSDTSYVFERRAGEDLVLRPWPVRPALAAGVGFP
jgi:hypothetical protein